MIILRIALYASPQKLIELKQTLSCMISDIRRETCCSKVNAYLDLEDENQVLVLSQWESREELDVYLRSDRFSALLGTRILLRSTLLAFIDKVATREGIETIIAPRI